MQIDTEIVLEETGLQDCFREKLYKKRTACVVKVLAHPWFPEWVLILSQKASAG